MNTRLLGTIGVLGAPMMLVEGILYGFQQRNGDPLIGLLSLLYVLGWMSSVVGLLRMSATGKRVPAKAVLVAQMIGLLLAAVWAVLVILPNPNRESILYQVADIAWPLSHLFMLVVGIAALVAKVLPGWRRWVPLLCGLVFPVAMVGWIIGGKSTGDALFGLFTALSFGLLGYAVRSVDHSALGSHAAGSGSLLPR